MLVKAKKVIGGYLIPNTPFLKGYDEIVYLKIEKVPEPLSIQKSKTIKELEEVNAKLGGDPFLELQLKNLPLDYEYKQTECDDDILYEDLKQKYQMNSDCQFQSIEEVWESTKDIHSLFNEEFLKQSYYEERIRNENSF